MIDEKRARPPVIAVREMEDRIADAINTAHLPAWAVRLVLERITAQIAQQEQREYAAAFSRMDAQDSRGVDGREGAADDGADQSGI